MPGSRPTTSGLAIINANPLGPVGIFNGGRQSETLSINQQMRTAAEFRDIVIKSSNGNFVRLSDVAEVEDSVRNSRSIAWFNKQPAVLIQITKQGDANVIDTVDRVQGADPGTEAVDSRRASKSRPWSIAPAPSAPASQDMQLTLLATAFLVMVVVFVFLRRITPTIAAGVSVPLALAGTCAGMWLAGFLDRQSVADGAGDLGRLRGRRRHRHDREHVPQSRARHAAAIRRRSKAPSRSASRCCRSACR